MSEFSRAAFSLGACIGLSATCLDQTAVIETYAGVTRPTRLPATHYAIGLPSSVISDGAGGFYVASVTLESRCVYRVEADGRLSLIAGCSPGFGGDGGPATSARLALAYFYSSLFYSSGLALDPAGNLYIADTENHLIRKVTADGIIRTVAGGGVPGLGDGDGGPATSAKLRLPTGIAVDATGNLYIADTENYRVRKVTTGGVISTVAGGGTEWPADGRPATSARLSSPRVIAVDGTGNLYIIESGRIRKVTLGGIISTVAGDGTQEPGDGGPATSVRLRSPTGIAVDSVGNLYIADASDHRIRKVTRDGVITTVAGSGPQALGDGGPATLAALSQPRGVAVDSEGNLYIADSLNRRVRKVTVDGVINTVAGNGTDNFSGDGGPASTAQLGKPTAIAIDAMGNLYIAEDARIRRVTADGIITTVAGNGVSGVSGDGGPATLAQLSFPSGVAVDVAGDLYIADAGNYRIRKVTAGGIISTLAGIGRFGSGGDAGAATTAELGNLRGIAVDSADNLYIAESHRIRKVTADGIISTVAGTGAGDRGSGEDGAPATGARLSNLGTVALDASGNLYYSELDSNRIRKATIDGVIQTVAGNGGRGFYGDGGRPHRRRSACVLIWAMAIQMELLPMRRATYTFPTLATIGFGRYRRGVSSAQWQGLESPRLAGTAGKPPLRS